MTTLYDFSLTTLQGEALPLDRLRGKVVLVVNVASACGYTPQYAGLQRLYAEAAGDGLVVLGIQANEFGAQEPGSNADIAAFCEARYGVTFPMAGKVVVKGDGQHPLYAWLTAAATPAGDVRWNFEKFLVGRDGTIVGRYPSSVAPESATLREAIAAALSGSVAS